MFQITTRTQYAVRALVYLANKGTVSLVNIAASQDISPKYLEGIFAQLKTAGLVSSARGRHGGYRLSRHADELSMMEIVCATEGDVRFVDCLEDSSLCVRGDFCPSRRFWQGLKEQVDSYLSSVRLGELAREYGKGKHIDTDIVDMAQGE